ncbi:MAG: FtsX-like permease family protein [Planctomycetota bacterium]
MLWGVDSEREASVSILPTNIVKGKFDFTHYGMVVGCDFAEGMNLEVGDKVAVYSSGLIQKLEQSRGQANIEGAMADEYTIRGIFDVGFGEYNSFVVVTSLEDARQMNLLPEGSSQALQVKLRDPFDADGVALELKAALGANYYVRTWKQADPKIFDALAVEKTMMFFLLFFIMIVAGFGIVNSQITFVVQKTAEIGILKSLGATNRQVLWLFLSQSVVVGVLGVGIGFGAALLALAYRNEFLFFLRRVTGIEILPSSVYGVYQLPAQIQVGDILVICGTAFLTCVLAGLFPAWKASRMQPVEALRYE